MIVSCSPIGLAKLQLETWPLQFAKLQIYVSKDYWRAIRELSVPLSHNTTIARLQRITRTDQPTSQAVGGNRLALPADSALRQGNGCPIKSLARCLTPLLHRGSLARVVR